MINKIWKTNSGNTSICTMDFLSSLKIHMKGQFFSKKERTMFSKF